MRHIIFFSFGLKKRGVLVGAKKFMLKKFMPGDNAVGQHLSRETGPPTQLSSDYSCMFPLTPSHSAPQSSSLVAAGACACLPIGVPPLLTLACSRAWRCDFVPRWNEKFYVLSRPPTQNRSFFFDFKYWRGLLGASSCSRCLCLGCFEHRPLRT